MWKLPRLRSDRARSTRDLQVASQEQRESCYISTTNADAPNIRTSAILILDDESVVTELLERALANAGHKCTVAANASEALDFLKGQSYAALLTDIRMPGMSGIELLRQVRQHYPAMAVIMSTGITDKAVADEAMKEGAVAYLSKPYDIHQLLVSVQIALNIDVLEGNQNVPEVAQLAHGLLKLYEPYLATHSQRVTALAVLFGRRIGLSEETIQRLRISTLVHEIGCIGVPRKTIRQERHQLSTSERQDLLEIPVLGESLLESFPTVRSVTSILRSQSEHYDGTGSPDGLKQDEIPYEARLMAVVNQYDVLCFARPPGRTYSADRALEYLQERKGTQFDPVIVDDFTEVHAGLVHGVSQVHLLM